ncbi:glycosyltransferase [Belnapia sp. T6]|uniref:Glycosyltransferase n=1 Tax=Belnapia mucosa TaxID=2804532 RepID=A0ABS1V7C6_9PROT|nr:glycosyltransferase [Belnapia mucosa]MBL6457512.1 glycosyltransferase [Belnapia mucosa]
MPPEASPQVTIVINTCNRVAHLRSALQGLRGLRGARFEVVVVNGPSTDGTAALLAEWGAGIKLRHCPEQNLSLSRNIGIAAAAGEVVAFIDDDAVPHPDWLAHLLAAYADPAVGAVGGYTVDNTGTRWQARKTVCDRFGNAHPVSDFFDERPLNRPGTPFYPSLLGTNSSFRMAALRQVGGFDTAYAYLLDETDLCLRLVDAGWQVRYEPTALVFHQFAPSGIRNAGRIARTLYPSAVSKAYFVARHGAAQNPGRVAGELERYRTELLDCNAWFERHGEIGPEHRRSLDQDLALGLQDGQALARTKGHRARADLPEDAAPEPFLPFAPAPGLRICMVSQGWPPATDAGIARWTAMVARELLRRGHVVHVITRAEAEESVVQQDGLWLHALLPEEAGAEALMADLGLPPNIAAWNNRVRREVEALKNFGLDVLSFPIWDLEAMACLHDPDLGVAMSLHTSYALARPFKPDWLARPLYEHFMVRRMIAAEARALATAPLLLANSCAVVADLEAAYGLTLPEARVVLAPHGTEDLLAGRAPPPPRPGCRILFVGRFEPRKGFDLAVEAALAVLEALPEAEFTFAGGLPDRQGSAEGPLAALLAHPRARFPGLLEREALETAYRAADLVLVPSRYESFGLVAIEAMAAGTPVVALAAGGLAEVVTDGVDGLLVPDGPEAAEALAAALLDLARDPARRAQLAAGARHSFETRFTIAAMVDRLEPAFQALAAAARNRREAA